MANAWLSEPSPHTRQEGPFTLGGKVRDLDDAVDCVQGPSSAQLITQSGDFECPYSRTNPEEAA
jgi:hypothetical protein